MTLSSSKGPVGNRCRAAAACSHCHARKSRCDAQQQGIPCSGCTQRGLTDCRLMPTARGKYIRRFKNGTGTNSKSASVPTKAAAASTGVSETPAQNQARTETQTQTEAQPWPSPSASQAAHPAAPETSPPITESPSDDGHVPESPSSQNLRELSWVDLFDAVLRTRGGEVEIDKACITYLGESFPICTVLEDFKSGGFPLLHHPGPPLLASSPTASSGGPHPQHMSEEDLAILEAKRVFRLPPSSLFDILMTAFVDNVYPLYPAVVLRDFITQWRARSLPWILCHAACFAGSAFCPCSALLAAGFRSRREALDSFYAKTKLLFDFGYERDKIVMLQSVTLLTFWPSSPNDVWTFHHWISFGVTLAESLGIHRSLRHLKMPHKDRSLLKRLWWILVIRDAFGAALFGRPVRINGAHCDVEYVTEEDFTSDVEGADGLTPDHALHAPYFAQVSALAVILRDIIADRCVPAPSLDDASLARAAMQGRLVRWRSELPEELEWDSKSCARNMYIATLSILYDTNLIYSNLHKPPGQGLYAASGAGLGEGPNMDDSTVMSGTNAGPAPVTTLHETTQDAAERIIELAGTMVLQGHLKTMPHEVFTGLFLAEAVSWKKVSSFDATVAKLGRAQVNSCQMIFNEVRDFWDPAVWVMQLFSAMLSRVDEQPGRFESLDGFPALDDLTNFEFFNDIDTCLGDIYSIPTGVV